MDLAAELARFNSDTALANWITGAVQILLDQAQKEAAHASAELRIAHTKIQALTLELAHLRRMRFGVRSEALTVEQRDLFQETWASDLAAAEAELAKQAVLVATEPALPRAPRQRAGRQPLPDHLPRIEHRHEPDRVPAANAEMISPRSARTSANSLMSNRCVSSCIVTSVRNTPVVVARRCLQRRFRQQ